MFKAHKTKGHAASMKITPILPKHGHAINMAMSAPRGPASPMPDPMEPDADDAMPGAPVGTPPIGSGM